MKRGLFGVAMATMVTAASAQTQVLAVQYVHESVGTQHVPSRSVLQQRIDLDVTNVTLASALDAIGTKANTKISYVDRVVADAPRVSVQRSAITVEEALRYVLTSTELTYTLYEGRVAIVAKPNQKAEQGIIMGRVVHSKTKHPVAGATIVVGAATKGITTGEDGTFRLSVPAGEHTITVRSLGMVRQSRQVRVGNDETVQLEIILEPSASVLDEVIVTGTVSATERRAIPNPITVITAEEIERRGITRVEQLLRGEVPGVLAIERGSYGYGSSTLNVALSDEGVNGMQKSEVYSRGASTLNSYYGSNPLKTYVDGVELLDPSYLGTIDPQSIDRIEIIVGPQAAAVYGSNAMAGVMQIFTKKGSASSLFDLSVDAKYGTIESSVNEGRTPTHNDRLSVNSGIGPSLSYSANASHVYSGHWMAGLWSRSIGGSMGINHVRGPVTFNGAVSMNVGRNGTANSINGGTPYWIEKTRSGEWNLPSRGYAYYQSNRVASSTSQNVSLNVNYQATPSWQHHLTIGRNQTTFNLKSEAPDYVQYGEYADTLYRRTTSAGQRASVNYDMAWITPRYNAISTTVTLGGNATSASQVASSGCSVTQNDATFVNCREGSSGQQVIAVKALLDDRNWGGFGSVRLGLFDQLYLTLGMRAEWNPSYGRNHKVDWTPTNGLAYTIDYRDFSVKLLASYGRSTRPPQSDWRLGSTYVSTYYEPAEYIDQFESPNLRPEYARGPQGGIEIYYGNRGSLTVNRYVQTISDLIMNIKVDSVHVTYLATGDQYWFGQYQYVNAATIRQHGWETTGTFNVGPVQMKGAYTWMDSRIKSIPSASWLTSFQLYEGMTFLGLPTHTGHISLSYATGPTSITFVTNYVGSSNRETTDKGYDYTQLRLMQYTARSKGLSGQYVNQGYTKSDLAMSQRITPSWNFLVNIVNIGNNFGTDYSRLWPTVGRQTTFGLQYRFKQ